MNIFVTSDLHVGQSEKNDAAVRSTANRLQSLATPGDILLLGGDYGNDDDTVQACFQMFRSFPGKKIAIPGNHDIWVGERDSSEARLERFRILCESENIHSLHHSPIRLGDIAFVGSLGWYDYSFQDDIGIHASCYEAKRYRKLMWGDAEYAKWQKSDLSVTSDFLNALENQIRTVAKDRPEKIIGLIHHVPTKDLLVHPRALVPKGWRFLNAFLGAERFGDLFVENNVARVFCGHIHLAKEVQREQTAFRSLGKGQLLVYENGRVHQFRITSS